MEISPIKPLFENKCYPSPISKKISPLSIIHSFQAATLNLSPSNYYQWYSIAANLIKLIDFPITHDLESLTSNLKILPPIIIEIASKPIATEGFKSTCGVILNLLSKAGLVDEAFNVPMMEFLTSIFKQYLPKRSLNSSQKKSQRTLLFDGLKEEEPLFSEKKKQFGFDSFLDICRIQNEKNISVNICDEFGRFSII